MTTDLQQKSLVRLVSFTPNPVQLVAGAAALCYDSEPSAHIVKFCIDSGHTSVLEHASFTFKINTSRIISQQFTRHRIASFSQRSQRYCVEDAFQYITPPEVESNPSAAQAWLIFQGDVHRIYQEFIDLGMPAEQARMALTNATTTVFYMTMNASSLRNFFRKRLCFRAQQDIRIIAQQMLVQVDEVAHDLFYDVQLPCVMDGFCSEGKMRCGKVKYFKTSKLMPTKAEINAIVDMYMNEVSTWPKE